MWTNLGSGVITDLWSAVISVCRMSPGPASINTRGCEWRGPARSRGFRGPDRLGWTGLLTHSELSPHLSSSPVIISRHPEYTPHSTRTSQRCSSHAHPRVQFFMTMAALRPWMPSPYFPTSTWPFLSPCTISREQKPTEDNYYLTNSSFLIGELYTCLLSSHWQIFWLIIIRIPGRRDIVVTS